MVRRRRDASLFPRRRRHGGAGTPLSPAAGGGTEGGGRAERHTQSRMPCPALGLCALCVCVCAPDSTLELGIGASCLARSPVTGPILRRDRRPSASFVLRVLALHFIPSDPPCQARSPWPLEPGGRSGAVLAPAIALASPRCTVSSDGRDVARCCMPDTITRWFRESAAEHPGAARDHADRFLHAKATLPSKELVAEWTTG